MEGAEAGNIQEPLTRARFVNPEAERSVLGAMLRSRQAAQAGLDGLGAGDFFDPGNREVFDAMRTVADGGQAVDLVTVDQELTRRGKLEAVGGAAYLIELTQGVPSAANVGAYIGIVKGLAKRRAAIQAAEALAQGLKDPAADVDAVLGQLRDAADGLETGGEAETGAAGRGEHRHLRLPGQADAGRDQGAADGHPERGRDHWRAVRRGDDGGGGAAQRRQDGLRAEHRHERGEGWL